MSKYITTKNWGTEKVDLTHLGVGASEMRPTEIHLKTNATKDEKEGFTFVLTDPSIHGIRFAPIIGQISLAMLNEALNELGYKIEKL